jgi:hypothetical protein
MIRHFALVGGLFAIIASGLAARAGSDYEQRLADAAAAFYRIHKLADDMDNATDAGNYEVRRLNGCRLQFIVHPGMEGEQSIVTVDFEKVAEHQFVPGVFVRDWNGKTYVSKLVHFVPGDPIAVSLTTGAKKKKPAVLGSKAWPQLMFAARYPSAESVDALAEALKSMTVACNGCAWRPNDLRVTLPAHCAAKPASPVTVMPPTFKAPWQPVELARPIFIDRN